MTREPSLRHAVYTFGGILLSSFFFPQIRDVRMGEWGWSVGVTFNKSVVAMPGRNVSAMDGTGNNEFDGARCSSPSRLAGADLYQMLSEESGAAHAFRPSVYFLRSSKGESINLQMLNYTKHLKNNYKVTNQLAVVN